MRPSFHPTLLHIHVVRSRTAVQRAARQLRELRFNNIDQTVFDKVPRREFIRCQHARASPYDLCILAQVAVLAADYHMIR